MKILRSPALIILLFVSFAFANPDRDISGTYGSSPLVKLELFPDHSFHYTDISNPAKPVDATGTWTQEKNRIELNAYNSVYPFHTSWKIDDKGIAVKSRKGMNFYRLVKTMK